MFGGDENAESGDKATEGEITVYTALEDEQVSTYLEDFNEQYPDITVNIVRESHWNHHSQVIGRERQSAG